MPARLGCCHTQSMNLMKMDPTTGAIIWTANILGVSTINVDAAKVEPLLGTSDVLVSVNDGQGSICRVDSTGSLIWTVARTGTTEHSNALHGFGSDGTNILGIGLNGSGSGSGANGIGCLNYAGSGVWSKQYVTATTVDSLLVGSSTSYAGNTVSPFHITSITNSTGLNPWTNTTLGGNFNKPLITGLDNAGEPLFLDQSHSNKASVLNNTNGNILRTATFSPPLKGTWGPAGFSFIAVAGNAAIGTTGTSLAVDFTLTSIGGAAVSAIAPQCCCNNLINGYGAGAGSYGSGSYYFAGQGAPGTGGTAFSIFSVNSSGQLNWVQIYGSTPSSDQVFGMCISDDGYLYVCGKKTTR